jgi:dihydroorotate dehydrogenase (fumarate)
MSPNLATTWLGLPLRHPLVVGAAAPLTGSAEELQLLEQAGAAAIVLHSLFEEQIERDQLEQHRWAMACSDSHAEAHGYVAAEALRHEGADAYLRLIEQGRARLGIPLVASLNGFHAGSWVRFARRLEEAGADALELNIYAIPTDPRRSSAAIEDELVGIVAEVRSAVALPLAVKLGPFYTNLTALAARLAAAGADGLTLFNRFYQPDLDIEALDIRPNLLLSTPHDLRLPLRWIALLHGRLPLDLAASGGVHRGSDGVRLLMAGAAAIQVVGALLRHGPHRLEGLREELSCWLAEHGYGSVQELIGCLDQRHCPDPAAYERAQYLETLHTYGHGEAIKASGPW